jgi:tetratricopeptide (TPR) repeat protein
VIAGLLAYLKIFTVPFIFDDQTSIVENHSIRNLWPPWGPLSPPHGRGTTVEGRPVVNLTFAVNYALGGVNPWGYHAVNLLIHILAGLALFGIVRHTLLRPRMAKQFGADATLLALAVAAIWMLHPLQTEAVTYVAQRAESLMGLFYFLTLYCFIRGVELTKPGRWYALSVAACLLGMGSKEVMVSAPLIVLLYDWIFVAGDFQEIGKRRWQLYLGLASTWVVLGYLVVIAKNRGGTAGFGGEVGWWPYALTQCQAIVHYLKLSVWPYPLVFDYGTALVKQLGQALPYALLLLVLAAGTLVALWRRLPIGFLGAWFFAILAPSSSVLPVVTQTMAEHRMYLPLVAVVVFAVLGIYTWIGRRSLPAFLAVAAGLGIMTSYRNADYRSPVVLWRDTAAKLPQNVRAYINVGLSLSQADRVPEAVEEYGQALRIDPDSAEAHNDLGIALFALGKTHEGLQHFERSLQLKPRWAAMHYNFAGALARSGQMEDAIAQYQEALRITPEYPEAHYSLGGVLLLLGRLPEAISQYEETLRIDPDYAEAHYNLGTALAQSGKLDDAISQYQEALRLNADYPEAHLNLGAALHRLGRNDEAIGQYQDALRIQPNYAAAHNSLANALVQEGKIDDAINHYTRALQIDPNLAETHYNLGSALERVGREPEAIAQYKQALKLRPGLAPASKALTRLRAAP